jgi:arylformamidase
LSVLISFSVKSCHAFPLRVFLHGGYWRANDKSDFSYLAPPFNERGVSVASLNYSLAPEATLDTMVTRTCHAVAWLWNNAPKLNFDRSRMFLSGQSAGAHLTAMAMLAKWGEFGMTENPLRGTAKANGDRRLKAPTARAGREANPR